MVCFGTAGNIISLITWRVGRRCKNFAGATYLTALALSDTCVLCTSGLKSSIELLFQINIWHLHEILCKLLHTTWHFFFLVSTWIIVSLTVERTIAVCQPLKTVSRSNKKREIIVVCIYAFVFLLINLPFTIGAKVLPVKSATIKNSNISLNSSENSEWKGISVVPELKCQAEPSSFYFKYENEYHNWFIDFGLLFSAPIAILTACNVIILVFVKRTNATLQRLPSRCHNKQNSSAMTARVVALCLTLTLSVGPYSIAALIPKVMSENKAVSTVFNDRLMMVFLLIWYINNSVNFLLYSVFGKVFRRDCAEILQRKCFCREAKGSLAYPLSQLSRVFPTPSYYRQNSSILSNKSLHRTDRSSDFENYSTDVSGVYSGISLISIHSIYSDV